VGVSPAGVTPPGDEIGRFWTSTDSTLGNNFQGNCPATSFWRLNDDENQLPNGALRIDNAMGSADCHANTCPSYEDPLTVVIEDFGSPPPGIGGDAYFVAWQVSPTPGGTAPRTWDFARTGLTPGTTETVYPFVRFPHANVTSSARSGVNIEVTLHYADVAPNFHGATGGPATPGALGASLPATSTIVSYDLMFRYGNSDPGRSRSLWTHIATVPYPGIGVPGVFVSLPCLTSPQQLLQDMFIAVGITFDGGAGPDVPSTLVGRATMIECDPNLAEPQQPIQRLPQKEGFTRRPAGRG
jgi:hypothetical protein